jgi:hypothetical protein
LKIEGRAFSPLVFGKAMSATARDSAFGRASQSLEEAEIRISTRHLRNLSILIGGELAALRDAQTEAYFDQPLPRQPTSPSTPIPLAYVSVDGGRIQTRLDGGGSGVEAPHWRETKNAIFMRMTGVWFEQDPCPDLPDCFRDRQYMKKLLSGIDEKARKIQGNTEDSGDNVDPSPKSDLQSWRPKRVFRTCLSSLTDSNSFGRMMEAEADSRGFYAAEKKAFVCDGLPYNWTIHQKHFRQFTPILDFAHAIERVHEVARAVAEDTEAAWQQYVAWVSLCWQGHADQLLGELHQHQQRLGTAPQDADATDPRRVLAEAITYITNNLSRMDYPRYRREGLPLTSAYMESFVKEMNQRVKSTEKFWNDGSSGEAILQLRAAYLCDDDRLQRHMSSRPGNPFRPNIKKNRIPVIAT